jgi:hypothetical protein
VLAWQLDSAGTWHRAQRLQNLAAQEELVRRAAARVVSAVD